MQYSWDDVARGALENAPTPVKSSVAAARTFACGLYRQYEGFFGNQAPQGPLEGLKRGVWDKICSSLPPVPTNPVPPLGTDTCACVPYKARVIVYTGEGNKIQDNYNGDFTGPFFGTRRTSNGGGGYGLAIIQGVCQNGVLVGTSEAGQVLVPDSYNAYVAEVRPANPTGACPSVPPPPPPPPPPPERQVDNVPITIAPNVTINAPVTLIRPTTNIDLRPQVEIGVGPFNVNFNLDGINIGINPTFAPTIYAPTVNLPPLPPGIVRPPPLPPGTGDCPDPCPDIDYDRILNAIKAERKYYAKPKTDISFVDIGAGAGGEVAIPPNTSFISVTITREPNKVQEQFGEGGPDVLYAGWCSVGRGAAGVRTPISYRDQTVPVPPFGSTFTWTIYNGGAARIIAIVEAPQAECQTSSCT